MNYFDRKRAALGMDPGTAAGRLLKDILFDFVIKAGHRCHHCQGELTRETLSIEHKNPWMAQPDPKASFFDLDNIGFSHRDCNSEDGRSRVDTSKYIQNCGSSSYEKGCRCDICIAGMRGYWQKRRVGRVYDPEKRRAVYKKHGK